jgi:aminopeptidase N
VTPADFAAAALKALPKERVQQNVQLIVRYIGNCYWRFLTSEARATLSPRLERALREGLAKASTASLKSTYFNAYRSTASSAAALSFLERVWARQEKVPGLPLAEPDEAALALDLAVRGVPHAAMILDEQAKRFTNPDRKERFEFVRLALSRDAEVREAWFAKLADVANRRREPWAAEGLSYLNHPLRADSSRHFVRPALDLLQEVQRTGDIFFPSNWINATLNGHTSPEVAATVRAFLAEHPDYPVRLRRIILQSADDVFRAAAIRAAASSRPVDR